MKTQTRKEAPRTRKGPRQLRSQQTRIDLLEGATRVLEEAGATGFTTNHIAKATGVSIGSLYQYYPNKAAILIDLHDQNAKLLWHQLAGVLEDDTRSYRARFEQVLRECIETQNAASQHHLALESAGVDVSATAEFSDLEKEIVRYLAVFLRKANPENSKDAESTAKFCFMILAGTLERIALRPLDREELRDTATAVASMLSTHAGL